MRKPLKSTAGLPTSKRPIVSTRLLQERIVKLEHENQTYRDFLFAIVKGQGRVRVTKELLNGLTQEDGVNIRDLGDSVMVEYMRAEELRKVQEPA